MRRLLSIAGFAALICAADEGWAQQPNLRSTASFAVLGGSVNNSGTTVLTGNVAAKPSGSDPIVKLGAVRTDLASQAQRDQALLSDDLAGRSCGSPRVYCVASQLSGVLTLDAEGDANAYWIFRTGNALTTAPGTIVRIVNGGSDSNVFWQADGPVTLGSNTTFIGNIVAAGGISLDLGANVSGRLLTHGTVTLNGNNVSMCCPRIVVPIPNELRVTVGMTYRQKLTVSGGAEPYQFSPLPPAQIVEGDILTITPDTTGKLPITVVATDATGCSGVLSFELAVDPIGGPVPTLSEWGIVSLLTFLAIAGAFAAARGGS